MHLTDFIAIAPLIVLGAAVVAVMLLIAFYRHMSPGANVAYDSMTIEHLVAQGEELEPPVLCPFLAAEPAIFPYCFPNQFFHMLP